MAQRETAPIQSMTGFASREGEQDGIGWQMDVRSVNGRSLDVRIRLPAGLDRHEPEIRRMIGGAFRRGNIAMTLTLRRGEAPARYIVNQEQLAAYVDAIQSLAASGSVAAPRADGLLALKGVIEATGDEETLLSGAVVVEGVAGLIADLTTERQAEGGRIVPMILGQLEDMDRIRGYIDEHPERSVETIKARVDRQIAALLSGQSLSEERLHQEAALIATRADVREELDRLSAHIAAARELLAEGGPVGRRLDFLAQELNRETNTICAKSPHHAVTAMGLELKAVVEQMREQVQNLE
ncbi:YicC/YloC family endoribonuclease [Acuticoccus sediminis]|uniref:YicC/YloC family endoribonuclease n=1 Tax=Acuticoccus sediminis TaxID=2184697 RepID=UPI001CFE8E0D|nr:YicC/YloC family endoribonuclease [Acuticoccus sediminis]